jgi:molecular chaperone DnaJ
MARTVDLYEILGVRRDATQDEIRKAYRRLAREHHPDVSDDPESEERFKEITGAYEILSDPQKRRQYDMFGTAGGPGGFAGPGPFGDIGDIFDFFFGGGSPFGPSRTRRRPSRTQPGEAVAVSLTLSFEEAAFGTTEDVTIEAFEACGVCDATGCAPGTSPSPCRHCGGSGEVQSTQQSIFGTVMTSRPCATCRGTGEEVVMPCESCRGEGRRPAKRTVTVEIPPGVADGMELRVAGAGHAGRAGGAPGDLFVAVGVRPHPVFERRGQDLFAVLEVPMTRAALGGEIEIETLDGPERVRLERGTQSGTVVRLKGRGVQHIERRGRGDLFLTIQVRTPEAKAKDERALLEQLAERRGDLGPEAIRLRRPGAAG